MEQLKNLQLMEREMISEGKTPSEIDAAKASLREQSYSGIPSELSGVGSLSETARNMNRGPRGIAFFEDGGEAESFFERFNPLTGSYRRNKPLSVRAAETAIDFSPLGTVEVIDEIYDEYQQEDPNLAKMGIMAAAEVAGYLPLAGPAVKTMVRRIPADLADDIAGLSSRSVDTEIKNYRLKLEKTTDLSADKIDDLVDRFSRNITEDPVLKNKELFTEDVFHFSKGNFKGDTFDPSRGESRFDRLGTHVGTQITAKDRSKVPLGDMDAEVIFDLPEGAKGGSTMPLRARLDKPYLNSDGEAFSESGLKETMNNYADQNKIADLDIAMEAFRKDLTDNGFTHIPYVNAIEDRGVVSNIMLTDRTSGDPAVLKGRFSKFEDAYDPRLMRADGGEIMNGIGSLNETARGMSRGPRGIGAYQQFAGGGPVYMANGGSPQELAQQQAYSQQMSDQLAQQAAQQSGMQTARTVANLPINPGFTGFPLMPRPQTAPSNIRGDGMSANDLQRMLSRQTIAPENVSDVQSDIQQLQQADVAKRAAARRDEAARRAREGNNPVSQPSPQPMPMGPFGNPFGEPRPFFPMPQPNNQPLTQQPMNIMGQPMQQPQFGMQQPMPQSQYDYGYDSTLYKGSGGIGSLAPAQQANPQQFGLQQQNMGGLGSPQPTSNVLF